MLVIKSNASRGDDNTRMTSILDRYLARPLTNEFANMCLATFVSRYRVITDSTKTEEADLEESKTETGKKYSCFIAWVQILCKSGFQTFSYLSLMKYQWSAKQFCHIYQED